MNQRDGSDVSCGSSFGPASRSSTSSSVSANRAATAQPAEPAPTTMKSNASMAVRLLDVALGAGCSGLESAELPHHRERVESLPFLGDLAAFDAEDRDPGNLDVPARRPHAHEAAGVRAPARPAHD